MPSQINQFRRRFLGTAAMTLAAGRLGLFDVGHAQSGTTMPVGSSRTHTSFASLKRIDAGALFDDATFDRTVASFDTPDHVSIVIHNYRWRLGLAEGERPMTASRIGSRPLRSSPCAPSRSKATPTARRIRHRPHMLPSSRASTCTGT